MTHDLATVERFCDRALLLERGEVAAIGDPRDGDPRLPPARPRARSRPRPARPRRAAERGGATARPRSSRPGSRTRDGAAQDVLPQGERRPSAPASRFSAAMEEPVFGVIFKNERGDHVFVTNTMFDGIADGRLRGRATRPSTRSRSTCTSPTAATRPRRRSRYQDAQRFADWREDFAQRRRPRRALHGRHRRLSARDHDRAVAAAAAARRPSSEVAWLMAAGASRPTRPTERQRRATSCTSTTRARGHRVQAPLLRVGARLPVDAAAAADAVRRPLRRVHADRPLRRRVPHYPVVLLLGHRALQLLRGGDQRGAVEPRAAREPAAQGVVSRAPRCRSRSR